MSTASLDELGLKYGTDKSSKGHNYLVNYEFYLGSLRNEAFNLIEIGGLNGASLKMWRDYFPKAQIVCLDINPEVKKFEETRVAVEIGNTGSTAFLKSIIGKYGKAKIILDDGSHRWDHMRIAFQHLYDMVEPDGFYVVEDIHTNYEGKYAGVDDTPFVKSLYSMVDFMNARGEARRGLGVSLPPSIVKAAAVTDYVSFVARSCVIKKQSAAPNKAAAA